MKHAGPVAKALTLGSAALIALSGSVQAQSVNGASSVDMGSNGNIINAPHITFPSRSSGQATWTNQALSGFVVPAGQLTGIAMDGSNVAHLDLLPIRGQSFSVADANDVTADVVQIDANGITTGALSILDSTSVDGDSNPVARPITVDNGQLMVGGTAVSAAGPTDTVNILDQTAVDTNNDPANQALTVDNGELLLNGNPVVEVPDPLPTAGSSNNMITVTRPDGTQFLAGRTEVTFADWVDTLRWSVKNGYAYGSDVTPLDGQLVTVDMTNPVRVKFVDSDAGNAPGAANGFNYPVTCVSRNDIFKWCNALSERTGRTPVFVANGEVIRTGGSIIDWSNMPVLANNGFYVPSHADFLLIGKGAQASSPEHANLNWGTGLFTRLPVGSFPAGASDAGALDIHGNVWEWSLDAWDVRHPYRWYVRIQGGASNQIAPSEGSFHYMNFSSNVINQRLYDVGFRIMRNID